MCDYVFVNMFMYSTLPFRQELDSSVDHMQGRHGIYFGDVALIINKDIELSLIRSKLS